MSHGLDACRVPCGACPFRREGGHRLGRGQILEITELAMRGGKMVCHKTVEKEPKLCAGAQVFAAGGDQRMFQSIEEMLETATGR